MCLLNIVKMTVKKTLKKVFSERIRGLWSYCGMRVIYILDVGACYRAFSHDVTAAILVFQNNETAAMLVYPENPLGVELFSHVNAFFCSN